MVSEKRHHRSASMGRYSFLACFTGGEDCSPKQPTSYEKLCTPGELLSGQKMPPTLQLGGKPPTKTKTARRSLSFSTMGNAKEGLGSKVKEACEQALEVAKKSSPHIGELFVGSQLLMQVTPASFGPKPSKPTFSPSIGFLHMASSNLDSSHHER